MDLSEYTKDGASYLLGWLGYTGQKIYDRSCLLRENDSKLEVVVPFKGSPDEISEWFVGSNMLFDFDSTNRKELPSLIWVESVLSNDTYCLVSPRITHRSTTSGIFRGHGILVPDFVVKGKQGVDYARVNKIRTYVPELTSWTGLSTLSMMYERKDGSVSAVKSFQASFEDSDPVLVYEKDGDLSLFLVPADSSTTHHDSEPQIVLKGSVSFESKTNELVDYADQMKYHLDLTGLLSLIAWRNIGIKSIMVCVEDDLETDIEGNNYGPYFRRLITKNYEPWREPKNQKPWLIRFKDIGTDGLQRWFEMKQSYRTPLDEITYIARMHEYLTLQSQIMLFGTAFEELGAVIAESSKECKGHKVAKRIQQVLCDCDKSLFADAEKISNDIANTYNAIKHPDFSRDGISREECLAFDNLFKVVVACKAIALQWIGCKLGCPETIVKSLKQESSISDSISSWM